MKRFAVIALLVCVVCAGVFAQNSIYVSAKGNDESDGRFDQTGGTISGNTSKQGSNPNVHRERGTLGSDLASGK